MSPINPRPAHQVHHHLPRCAHCGAPIRSGTRRPRLFCDRSGCRQAASRARRKPVTEFDRASKYQPPKNNERTATADSSKARKQWVACHSIPGGIDPGLVADWPVDLVGGQRLSSAKLDPILVQKILAAELGTPAVLHDGLFAGAKPAKMLSHHCMICGKGLTDPASKARWIGPECAGTSSLRVPFTINVSKSDVSRENIAA